MPKICGFVQNLPIFVGQFPQMLYLCTALFNYSKKDNKTRKVKMADNLGFNSLVVSAGK